MNNSDKIKTGFILGLIAQVSISTLVLCYILQYYMQSYFITSHPGVLWAFIFAFIIAPFVLSIIALSYIKYAAPTNGKERTYRVLAKIFSNVTIAESAVAFFFLLIYGAIIGAIMFF